VLATIVDQDADVGVFGQRAEIAFALDERLLGVSTASWRSTALAVGSTVSLAVGAYLGVQLYQATALPEEYRRGDQITTRVFWHNIFSGLAFHPDFAERYSLRIDDNMTIPLFVGFATWITAALFGVPL
jgi:hypothetical protein